MNYAAERKEKKNNSFASKCSKSRRYAVCLYDFGLLLQFLPYNCQPSSSGRIVEVTEPEAKYEIGKIGI
jgi:hypothetical protein